MVILLIECLAIVWFKGPSSLSIPSSLPSLSTATRSPSSPTNKNINRHYPLALGIEDATTPFPYHRYTQSILRNPARKYPESSPIRQGHQQEPIQGLNNEAEQPNPSQKRSLNELPPHLQQRRRKRKPHLGGLRRLQCQEQEQGQPRRWQQQQKSKRAAVDFQQKNERVKDQQIRHKASSSSKHGSSPLGEKKSLAGAQHSETSKSGKMTSVTSASQNRHKERPLTKGERKSSQLIPVMDEEGKAIQDHFVSPRDIDGDGTPDSYVLLRPNVGNQKYMMDDGLFDETLIHT